MGESVVAEPESGVDGQEGTPTPTADASPSSPAPSTLPPAPTQPRTFSKRGKVSEIACHFCRGTTSTLLPRSWMKLLTTYPTDRRKKCTGERPTCGNCHKRGFDCVYPETPRIRRGGRKRKDGSAAQPSRRETTSSEEESDKPNSTRLVG